MFFGVFLAFCPWILDMFGSFALECVYFLVSNVDLSSPLNYGTPESRGMVTPAMGTTPIRPRSDVQSDRKIRQVALGSGNELSSVSLFT